MASSAPALQSAKRARRVVEAAMAAAASWRWRKSLAGVAWRSWRRGGMNGSLAAKA